METLHGCMALFLKTQINMVKTKAPHYTLEYQLQFETLPNAHLIS